MTAKVLSDGEPHNSELSLRVMGHLMQTKTETCKSYVLYQKMIVIVSANDYIDEVAPQNIGQIAYRGNMDSDIRSWWYVIHTKPKQEARALLNLTNQGYECFLPMHKKQVVRRAAVVTQAEPLFSRYLFIQLDTNLSGKSWGPIRSTLGVSKLVVFGSEPARVDSGLIHLFKQRELSVADQVTPLFKTGDQVVIAQGPFAGLNATFQMSDGEMRAMVLIEVLNQVSKLKLPLADLRRVA